LPRQFWILRFQATLLDFVFEVEAGRLNVRLDFPPDEQRVPTEALGPTFAFLRLLHDAKDVGVLVQFEGGDQINSLGMLFPAVALSPRLLELARWACALSSLVGELGAESSSGFSIRDVFDLGRVAQFMPAARHKREVRVLVGVTIPKGALEPGKPAALVTNPTLRVGKLVYGEMVAISGKAEVLEEAAGEAEIRVESSQPRSLESLQLSEGHARTFPWDQAFERATAILEAEGFSNIYIVPWNTFPGR
jgi:hypothetical protein